MHKIIKELYRKKDLIEKQIFKIQSTCKHPEIEYNVTETVSDIKYIPLRIHCLACGIYKTIYTENVDVELCKFKIKRKVNPIG